MSTHKTSLFAEHEKLGAKLVDFAGWQMPIQYKNLKEEVLAVRNSVGMFDVSHMGEFFITGADALKFTDYLVTNDIASAPIHKAIYSPMCRPDATIIDDLIIYKLSADQIMICVNASNIQKDFDWIKSQKENFNCELTNRSDDYSLIAVQGPKSAGVLKQLDYNLDDLEYYGLRVQEQSSQNPLIIARTGYTGEDGFEIFADHEKIKELWHKLIELDVLPCGLGARDVLRLEVCYPLYGQELNDDLTPFDTGLKWTVKAAKENFISKTYLESYTAKYQTLKLSLEKGIPRPGYPIENEKGEVVGEVTSGTMSVILGKGIALARVEKNLYNAEDSLWVNIRGKKYSAIINKKPFVAGGHK